MDNIIEITGLNKSFGAVHAVRDLSFRVKKGELFAFLGVNGAGKSTTISIICGTLKPDSGKISVCGESGCNMQNALKKTGIVFQSSVLDKALSVKDNLATRAAFYGIMSDEFDKRLKKLDRLLGLSEILPRPVGKLSGGQRRKTDIARALLHEPELLILDEPTTGLDPKTRRDLWNAVTLLQKERGMTVFLTTHYMEEASIADYVVIIDEGKTVAEGTPNQLKNLYAVDYLTVYGVPRDKLDALGVQYEKTGDGFRISVSSPAEATRIISSHPELFVDYEFVKGKMDDVFLSVTGKKSEDQL